ncbi:MAG: TfoX/Sxy family protein [Rubrivivax sp.]|nr:TfoX/Sxy family protein [Rubrivivax sp.]
MPPRDALVEHCLELLAPCGAVSAQRMFGGHGLRIDGVFMALIAFERLYLKVDAQTRPRFEAAGCEAFVYEAKGKRVSLGYWTAPPQALESPDDMRPWARLALEAALRARSQPARRRAPGRSEKMPHAPASKR